MAKLTVNVKLLNVRSRVPATLPEPDGIVGTLKKGQSIDGTKVAAAELPNPALGDWYRDAGGHFYWGGGLEDGGAMSSNTPANVTGVTYNWIITAYGIDKLWQKTRGQGVKIAVVDTGLNYKHTNISRKTNISYYNIFNQSTKAEDCMDTDGHGTMCAGMIAAHGPDVYGIAPEADLLIIKATKNGNMDCGSLAIAIEKAVELQVRIISVSYDFPKEDPDMESLEKAVRNAVNSKVFIVASSGNGGSARLTAETYPACFENVLAVGASDKDRNFWADTTVSPFLDILGPGADIELMGLTAATRKDSGTSFSTPYIAAVCALSLSVSPAQDVPALIGSLKQQSSDKEKIKAQLQRYYDDQTLVIPGLGIVNPAV